MNAFTKNFKLPEITPSITTCKFMLICSENHQGKGAKGYDENDVGVYLIMKLSLWWLGSLIQFSLLLTKFNFHIAAWEITVLPIGTTIKSSIFAKLFRLALTCRD